MKERRVKARDSVLAAIGAGETIRERLGIGGRIHVIGRDKFGRILWEENVHNLVTTQGLVYAHGAALLGTTPITSWFIGLIDTGGAVAAGDTYASHAGWTEFTNYQEALRQAWTGVANGTGGSDNSAAKAVFTMAAGGGTIAGVALVGGGTDADTKGDTAGGGTLYSEVLFSAERALPNENDTLTIQYNQSHADDGS